MKLSKEQIIEWARDAQNTYATETGFFPLALNQLEHFATLVAAAAYAKGQEDMRERAAKASEEVSLQALTAWKLAYHPNDQGREMGADECVTTIRSLPIQKGGEE